MHSKFSRVLFWGIAPLRFASKVDDCAKAAIAITWNGKKTDKVVTEGLIVDIAQFLCRGTNNVVMVELICNLDYHCDRVNQRICFL